MKEILVVIPYLAEGAQGSELELAVTGWRRHFKEPYKIVVVGDQHPVVDTGDDIVFIDCPRIAPVEGQYLPHLDIVHKFREVRKAYPDTAGFIYACDDMYAVKDFTLDTVKVMKWDDNAGLIPEFDYRKERGWWRDIGKTRDLCRNENIPEINWVCHLPVYYDWKKLLSFLDKYDCDNESFVVENIYFNTGWTGGTVWWADHFKDEVKTSHPCLRPVGSVTWITNTNSGWSSTLEKILRCHYDGVL